MSDMQKPRERHPLSAVFPDLDAVEFQALTDSIDDIGVQNPIVIFNHMVLDGWHRYLVARNLGMACPEIDLPADIDPVQFVIAQNKARRHISKGAIALAVTAATQWRPIGANQHSVQVDNNITVSDSTHVSDSSTADEKRPRTECAPTLITATDAVADTDSTPHSHVECRPGKSTAELAQIAGTSARTIAQAKAVLNHAAPEVVDAVKNGAVGLPKAAQIARMPKSKQAAALTKPARKAKPPASTPTTPSHEEGPSEAEVQEALAIDAARRATVDKLLAADDKLAAVVAENESLQIKVAGLERRISDLLDEKAELVHTVKRLRRDAKRRAA